MSKVVHTNTEFQFKRSSSDLDVAVSIRADSQDRVQIIITSGGSRGFQEIPHFRKYFRNRIRTSEIGYFEQKISLETHFACLGNTPCNLEKLPSQASNENTNKTPPHSPMNTTRLWCGVDFSDCGRQCRLQLDCARHTCVSLGFILCSYLVSSKVI